MASTRKSGKSSSNKSRAVKNSAAKSISIEEFFSECEFFTIRMISSNFLLQPDDEDSGDGDGLTYGIEIELDGDSNELVIGFCECSVSRFIGERKTFGVHANYFFAAGADRVLTVDDKQLIAEYICKLSVAPIFRSFFDIIVAQGGVDVPPLPIIPQTTNVKIS